MRNARIVSLALGSLLLAAPLAAEEKPAPPAKKAAAPSHDEVMKAWQAASTPGKEHERMAKMAGTWTAKVKAWMEPGKPPEETDGTSEMKMVLGGRFLQQTHSGTMMGQPFEGIGYTGYDNYKKRYVATWMDNAGTMILVMSGNYDKGGKTLTLTGTMDDMIARKPVTVRSVTHDVDADHQTFEMWMPGPDGKPMKMMEIAYTRKK